MASITNDKETKGKWRVRAIDTNGDDVELYFDTHAEAQVIANVETKNRMTYFGEFQKIDGLNQHPSGLNFRDWLKSLAPSTNT